MAHFCAFCLAVLDRPLACGQCRRRSYCSRQCQTQDYADGIGQAHKRWCGLNVREEGIDWTVQQLPGKGLGVVALRKIGEGERIMVERAFDYASINKHPALAYLEPFPGDTSPEICARRFQINAMDADDGSAGSFVCLRMCRVNHSCCPNSVHLLDRALGVAVLLSSREIFPGEEITYAYIPEPAVSLFPALAAGALSNYAARHDVLLRQWDFKCPADCICRSSDLSHQLGPAAMRASEMYQELVQAAAGHTASDALAPKPNVDFQVKNLRKLSDDFLSLAKLLRLPIAIRVNAHFFAFFVANRLRLTNGNEEAARTAAEFYLRGMLALLKFFLHPTSPRIVQNEILLKSIAK